METKLNSEETQILKRALSHLALRSRTGEIGIHHGANRFVSTNDCFKKKDLEALDSVFKKVGIPSGVYRI